jgi:anaerobic selenocysteine-containing dehydrogenase
MGPEFKKKYLHHLNLFWALEGKNALNVEEKYTWEQINDKICRNFFGNEHGLDWFKINGGLEWPKQPEEAFWRYEIGARVPIYWEFIAGMGEKVREIAEPRGINLDWGQFTPLPTYFSCHPNNGKSSEYDLYAITYRDILHSGSATHQHPEIDQASMMNPYSHYIIVNEDVGKRKGLKDGQLVWVESDTGRRVKGRIKLMQGIHPQVIAFAATSGHWSKHMPIAFGKGVHFNDLLEIDKDHIDPVSLSVEASIKVKIYPAKED